MRAWGLCALVVNMAVAWKQILARRELVIVTLLNTQPALEICFAENTIAISGIRLTTSLKLMTVVIGQVKHFVLLYP